MLDYFPSFGKDGPGVSDLRGASGNRALESVPYLKGFISALVLLTLTICMNLVKFLGLSEPQVPPLEPD